jgi:hypothetical protein
MTVTAYATVPAVAGAAPRRLSAELEQRVCEARQLTGWGPWLVAGAVGVPHQTVWNVLGRHALRRAAPAGSRPDTWWRFGGAVS